MYVTRLFWLWLALAALGFAPSSAYAQDQEGPYIEILRVDTAQAPVVQLVVSGGNLPQLSSAPITLYEGAQEQVLISDQTVDGGLQLAIAIDPHDLLALGASGQSHQDALVNATLELVEREVITRNVDLLAVYTVQPGGEVQTIQDWTGEPNLVFNSIVQNAIDVNSEDGLQTSLIAGVLNRFEESAQPSAMARSLLFFSSGATSLEAAALTTQANRLGVHVHVVAFAGTEQTAGQTEAMQELARQTRGRFVDFAAPQDLAPLWEMLSGMRSQRLLTYQSTSEGPAEIRVSMGLPDGSFVEAEAVLAGQQSASRQEAAVVQAATATPSDEATAAGAAAPAETAATVAEPVSAAVTSLGEAPTPASDNEVVTVPGTALALPRAALQLALPILISVAAYFVYREMRERRARKAPRYTQRGGAQANKIYELSEETDDDLQLAPRSKAAVQRYHLQEEEEEGDLHIEQAPSLAMARPRVALDDDEATAIPRPMFGDDEATYRLAEKVEQPVIGYFVRVSGNPTLPDELPIYGLAPTRGEARQIYIGRHTKNNTVVINDKSVSREHAVLVQREGRLYVRDNASTAGTFLNGKRLNAGEELLLRHNDLLGFGEIVYEFRARGEDEATVVGE